MNKKPKTATNPKGSGPKFLPYRTKQVRVPEPMIPDLLLAIDKFKKEALKAESMNN